MNWFVSTNWIKHISCKKLLISSPQKWNANRFCVQIRFALNVGPGIDGGDPDDSGESPGGEDHQGGDLRRPTSSVRKWTSDGEVPWKMILRKINLVILDL